MSNNDSGLFFEMSQHTSSVIEAVPFFSALWALFGVFHVFS